MNKKTFGLAKEGEKIYKISVNRSKLVEDADGNIIETLTINSITKTSDFYYIVLELSNGTYIRANINSTVSFVETCDSEMPKNIAPLSMDFFSQSRHEALKAVSKSLEANLERMNNIKSDVLKISNSDIVSGNIVKELCAIYPDSEKKITDVEFAEMALC